MIQRFTDTDVTWVDLSSPTPEEIRIIMEEYNIPPELLGDLSGPVPRSEAVASERAIKVTLDFPMVRRKDVEDVEIANEIKFLVTKNTLVTVRYEETPALHKFGKEFEVLSTLKRATKETHGGFLFVALMSALYDGLAAKLDYVESRLAHGTLPRHVGRHILGLFHSIPGTKAWRQALTAGAMPNAALAQMAQAPSIQAASSVQA